MTTSKRFAFTEAAIAALPHAEKDKEYYVYDTRYKDLIVRVGNTRKIYYLYKKVGTNPLKVKIGDVRDFSLKNAIKEYTKYTEQIRNGKNPNDIKRRYRQDSTLKQVFDDFMERYSKPMKKSWAEDEWAINDKLSHWFNRRIADITKPQIQEWFEKVGRTNGTYAANHILERLRAMYNKAIEWGWEGENPTNGIKKFKTVARDRFIEPDELMRFFRAVEQEDSAQAKNYVYLSLFTGARKNNILAMRWDEVDFDRNVWCIPDTKNGDPLEVPLTEPALEVLNRIPKKSEWVFPSKESKSGHLNDPKKAWARILEDAGITDLRMHDLRRTLASYQAITGSSLLVIGKSLGHKSAASTEIYARLNNESVRQSMETATQKMLEYKDKKPKGKKAQAVHNI